MKKKISRKMFRRTAAVPATALLAASLAIAGCGDSETEETSDAASAGEEAAADDGSEYVMMNIPYNDYYEAELDNNDVEVDAVSSATTDNWSQIFSTTSYSPDGGNTINGITYPVKTTAEALEEIGAEEVESDALSSSGDYTYYAVEAGDYTYYKELTAEDGVASFGEAVYEEDPIELSDAEVTITTESDYGDYELGVSNIEESGNIYASIGDYYGDVYAVVITAVDSEGTETDYGLRQLENTWEGGAELSFAVNEETYEAEQENLLSYEHYASIVGQTITQLTYYTAAGIYVIPTEVIVPTVADAEASAEDVAKGTEGLTVMITDLPEDFVPSFSIDGEALEAADNGDGTYTLSGYTAESVGANTVTISDESGLYADMNVYFTVTTDEAYAVYDEASGVLTAAEGISDEEFTAYLESIESVSVDGTNYETEGRSGVAIVTSDGSIDTEAVGYSGHGPDAEEFNIFESGSSYALVVYATGYPDLSFTYTVE